MFVEVGGGEIDLKCWIFKKGSPVYYMFLETLVLEGADNMSELMSMARPYISRLVELLADQRFSGKSQVYDNFS